MALSGAFEGSIKDGHYKVRVEWSATQDIANNQSTITAKLYMINDWNMSISARSNAHSVTIDGTTTTFSTSAISGTGTRLIGTATKTVTHNSDGTKSVAMSAVFAIKAYFDSEYVATITASSTITLDTIARASQPSLSASSVEMGNEVTIYTNRASSSFTHTLKYTFGSLAATIASGVGASTTWSVPLELAHWLTHATSGTCTITCETYNGSTLIGTKTVSLVVTVPASIVPSISVINCSDPNGYATTYGGYVQGKSKVKIDVSAGGSYKSEIKSYKITANGVTYTANGCTTGVLLTAGTNTISVTVTDSRGRTATKTKTISVLAYTSPTILKLSAVRCLSDGTENEDGAYMCVGVTASVTALNNKNKAYFQLRYKKTTESSWTVKYTWDNTAYAVGANIIIDADTSYSYDVQMVATDSFGTATANAGIGTSFTLLDFSASGKGMAVGKVSEQDAFECDLPAVFTGNVTASGEGNVLAYDYICHSFGTDGTARYIKFARLKVNSAYVNANILMNIAGRARIGTLTLTFKSASTAEAATIAGISQEGNLEQIYYVPVGSGIFDLYMYCSAWAYNTITSIELSQYARNYVTLTWESSTASSLPTGYVAASRYFNRSSDTGYFSKLSVGGYDSTANYALTASSFLCNDWVRTGGGAGWYSQSYGGGIRMQDTTWIRTFGDKSFYCNKTIQGAAVKTDAGANLDTLDTFRKYFEFDSARKKLSFMGSCYYNNTGVYGFTIRWGSSSLGTYVDDTYWLTVRYDGLLAIGYQLNGATKPTWVVK